MAITKPRTTGPTRRFAGGGLVNPLLLQRGGQDDTNPLLAQSLSALKPPGARRVEQRNPLLKMDQDIAMGNAVGELSNTERYQLDNPLNRPYKAGDVAPGSSAAASQLNQHTDIMSTLRDKLAEDPLYAGYADGGKVESAEELLARMQAKYKTGSASSEPEPAAPAPKPMEQKPQVTAPAGLFGVFQRRKEQIDKAAGYANGGMIDGPGTSTSDSIPAKVKETGEPIGVSTDERIVSKPQNALLEIIAKGIGYDSLDHLLEDGTGKPVGPTIKAGKQGAATGKTPDDDESNGVTPLRGTKSGFAQFAQNGLTYDVQDTGQAGIKRVNAPGQKPLYTNSDPAQAVADMAKMKPGEVIFGPSGPGRGQRDPGWIDDGYGNDARPTIALKKELADLERDRYGRDLQSNITDPKAMALAQINLSRMNAEDKQHGEVQSRLLDSRIKQTKLSSESRLNDLQAAYADESDPTRRDELGRQIRGVMGRMPDKPGVTLQQERGNLEIDAARKTVAGLSPEEIRKRTAKQTNTGRENPDFDPTLEHALTLSGRRKVGNDDWFDQRMQPPNKPAYPGNDGDTITRFRADQSMKGHRLGQQTENGTEVFDSAGKLIGYYR